MAVTSLQPMKNPSPVQMRLLKMTEGLIRYRFDLARLAFSLEGAREETEDAGLRADLECAIVDHFDPLLRTILEAAGDPRGKLLEAALDLAGLRHRLDCLRESLPSSPEEDAMIDGDIPTDVPTEMKLTLMAVVEDQLNLAYENLLHAAGYYTLDLERLLLEAPEAEEAA